MKRNPKVNGAVVAHCHLYLDAMHDFYIHNLYPESLDFCLKRKQKYMQATLPAHESVKVHKPN